MFRKHTESSIQNVKQQHISAFVFPPLHWMLHLNLTHATHRSSHEARHRPTKTTTKKNENQIQIETNTIKRKRIFRNSAFLHREMKRQRQQQRQQNSTIETTKTTRFLNCSFSSIAIFATTVETNKRTRTASERDRMENIRDDFAINKRKTK